MQRAIVLVLSAAALAAGLLAGCGEDDEAAPADRGAATATPAPTQDDTRGYGY
jgi:hypothetical protein